MYENHIVVRTREVLRKLEDSLLGESDEVVNSVLAVLSALRGPDEKVTAELKPATTAVIRRYTFPRLLQEGTRMASFGLEVSDDSELCAQVRQRSDVGLSPSSHFGYHYRAAFTALNLHLYEVNPPREVESGRI